MAFFPLQSKKIHQSCQWLSRASIFKLVKAIKDAKAHQKYEKNAFGRVNHKLIQFALLHYHCNVMITSLTSSSYSGLQAMVSSTNWYTPCSPCQVGVFQGNPMSVAIFDMPGFQIFMQMIWNRQHPLVLINSFL